MAKKFAKVFSFYFVTHAGLMIFYYFLFFLLKVKEEVPIESSKFLIIAFTVANLAVFWVCKSFNAEKRESKKVDESYIFYMLLIYELIALIIVYIFIHPLF